MALGAIHTTTLTGRFFEGYRLWERRHQKPTQQAGRWLLLLPIDRLPPTAGSVRAHHISRNITESTDGQTESISIRTLLSIISGWRWPTLLLSSEGVERRQPAAGFPGRETKKKKQGAS